MTDELSGAKKDLIIAEYNAVRAAANQKATAAQASVAAYFTLVAALVGFIASAKADIRFLLVVPVLSAAFGATIVNRYASRKVALNYIRDVIRPLATELVSDARFLGFDDHYAKTKARESGLLRFGLTSLFPLLSLTSIAVTAPKLSTVADTLAWVFGLACFGALFAIHWKAGHRPRVSKLAARLSRRKQSLNVAGSD